MTELDEMVREFLIESTENLEQLDRELLMLEENPRDLNTVNVIFRIVHTVKGTCGFFEFTRLESVSHVGENLLDSIRSKKVAVTDEIITALLKLTDTLRELLGNISETGHEGNGDYSEIVAWLVRLNQVGDAGGEGVHESAKSVKSAGTASVSKPAPQQPIQHPKAVSEVELHSEAPSETDLLDELFEATRMEWENKNAEQPEEEGVAAEPPSVLASLERKTQSKSTQDTPASQSADGEAKRSEVVDTTLRVDISLLDKLMNLVGELVLARNQILQFTKSHNDGEFVSTSQRLNLITSELQDGVMRTRMQPISTVWNKLPRIVRDIAHACNKEVSLETFGKETELDKTIIEAIKDPLTHIIRNAVDHGIETPEKRKAAGKSPDGILSMRAFHEGGQVIIEISDNGAGLNTQRIRAKAIEKDLITAERAESMTEADIHRLVFLPGFSTAEKVTNLSGRGVGMDVVRSNIERIGGTVDVTSKEGHGTVFTIKIPLTLAIIPALIVTAGGNRYAIPQVNLLELVRIESSADGKGLERIQSNDFYRLRGRLLPIVYLGSQLGLTGKRQCKEDQEHVLNMVVVRADHHQFGLVVDEIHDTEEIVVKPLGRLLKGINSFAGATIMGDGQVALILDIVGIGRNARISRKESSVRAANDAIAAENLDSKRKLLVFKLTADRRGAVPLEQVYRLEEFPAASIERAGEVLVVQYRDGILPLVDMRGARSVECTNSTDLVRAFVYSDGNRLVGFVVDQIVDIVEQAIKIETPFKRAGIVGSAIVQQHVTDIVDLKEMLGMSGVGAVAQA